MSGFSSDWLSLREPFDNQARSPAVLQATLAAIASLPSVHVTDLACGTGSTFRALSAKIDKPQVWRLVDNDLSLLARAGGRPTLARVRLTTEPLDLARDVEAALDGTVDLVTTSALLDLVSAEWLERLAIELAVRRIPFYAALTYDGRIEISPSDNFDSVVVDAVNRHQRGQKGFGPALGPDAAKAAVKQFEKLGYRVVQATSDWVFSPKDHAIQSETLAGWAAAANEIPGTAGAEIASWLARRNSWIRSGSSRVVVGHVDFVAFPPSA